MKKIMTILFSMLLIGGTAYAFLGGVSPDSTDGQGSVVVPVYNNSGSALSAGDVVVWDIDASPGDNDLYVTTTTTAETALVAGVVYKDIAAGEDGSIVVYGFAQCNVDANGVAAAGLICSSSTAKKGKSCVDNSMAFAIAPAAIDNTTGTCFVINR